MDKIKTKYKTVGTVPNRYDEEKKTISHSRNISKIPIDISWKEAKYIHVLQTHVLDRSLSWLGTCT